MIDTIISSISRVVALNPFSIATWFVIGLLLFFLWLFMQANKDPKSPVAWEDLIVNTDTERTSPYKLGYLIGLIVSTWIVITFADTDKLTFDIFGLYLSFLLGGAGWAAFMQMKAGNNQSGNTGGTYYNRPNYYPPPNNQNRFGNDQQSLQSGPNAPKLEDEDPELDAALPPNKGAR